MITHAGKTQKDKRQLVASAVFQKQHGKGPTFQFVNNRPEAIAQLKEIANNRPQVKPLRAFQKMTNNSLQAKQAVQLQSNADKNSQVIQRNPAMRPTLSKKLMSGFFSSKNPFTRAVFKTMNAAMWVERQPLSEAHRRVLEESLLHKQNGILDTLIAENPYVMATKGRTPVYLMGKYFVHKPLQWYLRKPD